MNTVFEGATLDILHGVAVFTSGITCHVLHTRNLKTAKNHDDLIVMIRELEKRKWFTSEMRYQIERYVIRYLNEF